MCRATDTPVLCDEIQSCAWYDGLLSLIHISECGECLNRRHHKKSGNTPVAGSRFLPICWNCRGFLFAPRRGGANRHNSLRRIEFLYRISVRGRRRKKCKSFGILRKLAVCPANAQTIKNRRQSRGFYIFLWESQCVLEKMCIRDRAYAVTEDASAVKTYSPSKIRESV